MHKDGLTQNSSGWFNYLNMVFYKLCGKNVFTIKDNLTSFVCKKKASVLQIVYLH